MSKTTTWRQCPSVSEKETENDGQWSEKNSRGVDDAITLYWGARAVMAVGAELCRTRRRE